MAVINVHGEVRRQQYIKQNPLLRGLASREAEREATQLPSYVHVTWRNNIAKSQRVWQIQGDRQRFDEREN